MNVRIFNLLKKVSVDYCSPVITRHQLMDIHVHESTYSPINALPQFGAQCSLNLEEGERERGVKWRAGLGLPNLHFQLVHREILLCRSCLHTHIHTYTHTTLQPYYVQYRQTDNLR